MSSIERLNLSSAEASDFANEVSGEGLSKELQKMIYCISVADNYGVSVYAIYLFFLTIWWGLHWGDATACPYTHFEDCILGSMKLLEVGVRTAAAVFGGVAVFK